MKIKVAVISALIGISISTQVMADITFGGVDCGKWIKEPTEPRKAWLLGFMSALNLADYSGSDALSKLSSAYQIWAWMDKYCRANPLKNVSDGGMELHLELLKMK